MQKYLPLLICITLISGKIHGQTLSAPNVEDVWGGRINTIAAYDKGGDTTRLFISTESANSVFYADVITNPSSSSSASFSSFTVMPGLSSSANYGGGIQNMYAHASSGNVYFTYADKILSSNPSSSTVNTVSSSGNHYLHIKGDYMFYFKQGTSNTFNFGTLNSSGTFTASAGSPLTTTINGSPMMAVNPSNNKLYVFVSAPSGMSPKLYRSSDAYTAFSSTTTFTDISPTTLSTSIEWRGFGIGPDGRVFIGGSTSTSKYMSYTDNDTTWKSYSTNVAGVAGTRIAFSGTGSSYYVYFSAIYNNHRGDSGYWQNYGNPGGFETHPNDGDVFTDVNDSNVVYMTTDQGIGASTNRGSTIFEIDEGVEAVQVNDFDMTSDKNTAWIASKAGIRKVSNYQSSRTWTNAMFPNGDGSPYYSAEMSNGDTNTVYVGNLRVYKTNNGGSTWGQIFSPENAPYNYGSFGASVEAIEVCDYDANTIFAGYSIQGTTKGGLYYSTDGGSSWNILRLSVTSGYNDVDVYDIIFNIEGSDTVAYVGVDYDVASPTGRSIYRIVKSGSTWTPAQDMNPANTSTGTTIVVTIRDLHKSITGDTLFACGNDAGSTQPVAYYKPISATNKWTPYGSSGFPATSGKKGSAITLGVDTVYCAVDNEIYIFPTSGTAWSVGYTYPVGTQINFLYYDELLAGTGTGLYGHTGLGAVGLGEVKNYNFMSLNAWPNPATNEIRVSWDATKANMQQISIYDLHGKEVLSTSVLRGANGMNLNTEKLSSGIYLIRANSAEGAYSLRFVKN